MNAKLAALFLTLIASQAQAGVIIQPDSATSGMGAGLGTDPERVINQSGLSSGYSDGATDFDTYIASNPTHASNFLTNIWISGSGVSTGDFDFDLGDTFTIESFALWNIGENDTWNVRGFVLLADDESTFTGATILGTFNANPNTAPETAVLPEVFAFAPTAARYVRMQVTSNNGGTNVAFGEAAFEAQFTVVPEPSSFALVSFVAAGFLIQRNRVRKAVS